MEDSKTIRVLVADDNDQIAAAVASLLEGHCEIVGRAAHGEEAIELAARLQPDVLVLDISMPVLNGMRVLQHLNQTELKLQVVVLTGSEEGAYVDAFLTAGARAFVLKSRMATDLLHAITEVIAGRTFVSKSR